MYASLHPNWKPRFSVPVFYEDACGKREFLGQHSMLLPHEIVGTFYRFAPVDLMSRLIGKPGESRLDLLTCECEPK